MLKILPLETLIFEDESGVKTTRPSNKDTDKVEDNAVIELTDEEPYVTPFLLGKKKRKVAPPPPPEDSEAENSEIELQLRGKLDASKKAGPVKSSSDKVR
jgi:hypothetical protein